MTQHFIDMWNETADTFDTLYAGFGVCYLAAAICC